MQILSWHRILPKACTQRLCLHAYRTLRIRRVGTNVALLTSLWKVGNFCYLPCTKGSRQEILMLPGTTYLAASSGTSKHLVNSTSQHDVTCRWTQKRDDAMWMNLYTTATSACRLTTFVNTNTRTYKRNAGMLTLWVMHTRCHCSYVRL